MKKKMDIWMIAIIIAVVLLLGFATWKYFSSKGLIQFGPGDSCGEGKILCNEKCQLTGLVCSKCAPETPFKRADGCANSPGKIGG